VWYVCACTLDVRGVRVWGVSVVCAGVESVDGGVGAERVSPPPPPNDLPILSATAAAFRAGFRT